MEGIQSETNANFDLSYLLHIYIDTYVCVLYLRSKIVISNIFIEQINTFNYLGCSIHTKIKKHIAVTVSKFLPITRIIKRNLK
jgi:hypothetical protein